MPIKLDRRAEKAYKKLDSTIKNKVNKKFLLLDKDTHHPSLFTKKKQGEDVWEARIDYHYRFTFIIEEGTLLILTIGIHDEGLGKK